MASKRIKYARAHLSRRKHIAILATPLWRRTQSTDFNTLPHPFSVPRTALKAQASRRIKMMSRPKNFKRLEKRSHSQGSLQYPRRRDSQTGESNTHLLELALPKKSALIHARQYSVALGNRNQMENINNLLLGIRKSRYQKYRIICNTLQQRAAAREKKIRRKLHRALTKPGDWERHNRALKKLAAPKRVLELPEPTTEQKEKKQGYSKERLNALAQPMPPRSIGMPDPFCVKKSALTYMISERMTKLAQEKNIPDPPFNVPGRVVPGALLVVASNRIAELAKSVVRPLGLETNQKMEAFTVSPLALKARCSPRLKILAKPKKRPPKR